MLELSRRQFLEIAAGTAVANVVPESLGQSSAPPNVVFMLGDDHRWDALGCMGNPIVHTPQLDRLAREGVLFENHLCTTPICCASRASIMLGQYAATTGIYDFATPLNSEQVKESYWHRMKSAGYRIGFIGKFGVGNTMPSGEFDYWEGFPGQGDYYPRGKSGPHLTSIMEGQAQEFLESSPHDKPFCLSISFKAPHVQDESPRQYLPMPRMLALYDDVTIPPVSRAGPDDIRRFPLAIQHSESRHRWGVRFATPEIYQASVKGYYGLISGIDTAIGSIRQTLDRLGLADNTIIVYSADHGIFNGEHGLAGKWYGYEESLRIPLVIYDPRLSSAAAGRRIHAMSLNIDLNPTVLEMAGMAPSTTTQGRSLVPFLRHDVSDAREVMFFEHHFPFHGWIPSSEGIRTSRWKYIRYTDSAAPAEELYDLRNDPTETQNLIDHPQYAHRRQVLTRYSETWRSSLYKSGTTPWTEPVNRDDLIQDGMV